MGKMHGAGRMAARKAKTWVPCRKLETSATVNVIIHEYDAWFGIIEASRVGFV